MANIKTEWEVVKEAEAIVTRLCELYPEKLGHVSADTIGCAQITNKDKPDSQSYIAKIVGVKMPISLYCQKIYVIMFHKNVWDVQTKAQKSAIIMGRLLRIPDEPDGAVTPEDLKDSRSLVKAFGVDYLDNPKLPDLAAEKVNLPE